MRPVRFTISAAGTSNPIPLDIYIAPFQVSVNVFMSAGATVDYSLQYTYDDVLAVGYDPAASTSQWIDDTTMDNEVASSTVNITAPITAVRIVAAAVSGGTLAVTILQAGNGL